MTEKESYNERMNNYFKSVEVSIEDSKNIVEYVEKQISVFQRKLLIEKEYLSLAEGELERAKENLRKYNEANPDGQ